MIRSTPAMHQRVQMEKGEELTVTATDEFGPQHIIHIDQFGLITIQAEYRTITVCSQDPGPGGISIWVDGEHEDGTP